MPTETIGRREFEECVQRLEAEDKRHGRRLDILEETTRKIADLTVSVKEIAMSVQTLTREMERHTRELEAIKSEPGNKWRALVYGVIGAVAGIIGTALFNGLTR